MRHALLAFLTLIAGCATDATQVMLVIQGDFDVPTEVDSLDLVIEPPAGVDFRQTLTVPLTADEGFPRVLGIVRGDGGNAEYLATITAKRGGATVVTRRVEFVFRNDEVRMLEVTLTRACLGVSCSGADRTCGNTGVCDRIRQDTEAWNGIPEAPNTPDAGP